MKCPKCSGERFSASQVQYVDVVVDGKGYWLEDLQCFEADRPYGPYACLTEGCDFVTDELEEQS